MKLLIDLLGASNETHIRVVEELKAHHDIVYWVTMRVVPIDTSAFPNTLFHNYHDAVKNISASGVDAALYSPWSADEIAALSEWEMIFLVMVDKWYPNWSVTKRYDFYFDLLRYWSGVLDQCKPDCIIFNGPPHHMYNLVLFAIAKQRGIKTVIFDVTFRLDRIITYEDYRVGNPVVARACEMGYGEKGVSLEDLAPHLREHYLQVSRSADPPARHFADFKKETARIPTLVRRAKALWPFIKDGSVYERAAQRLFKMLKSNSKSEYQTHAKPVDFTKPYVYVPLHYQPECTTSPQGGIFVDQVLAIRILSAALPNGWELYVKEHPAQWPAHLGDFTPQRYECFYADIAAIPHVRLVPVNTNTFELADHAKTTATVSGTAGWESILRGTCALIFGYPWFMHSPGVFRVSSVADCREAFRQIENGVQPDVNQIFKYLALLDTVSFPGYLDVLAYTVKTLERDEEWKVMYHALESALADNFPSEVGLV